MLLKVSAESELNGSGTGSEAIDAEAGEWFVGIKQRLYWYIFAKKKTPSQSGEYREFFEIDVLHAKLQLKWCCVGVVVQQFAIKFVSF